MIRRMDEYKQGEAFPARWTMHAAVPHQPVGEVFAHPRVVHGRGGEPGLSHPAHAANSDYFTLVRLFQVRDHARQLRSLHARVTRLRARCSRRRCGRQRTSVIDNSWHTRCNEVTADDAATLIAILVAQQRVLGIHQLIALDKDDAARALIACLSCVGSDGLLRFVEGVGRRIVLGDAMVLGVVGCKCP